MNKYIRLKHKGEVELKKSNGHIDLESRPGWKYAITKRDNEYEINETDAYEFKLKNKSYEFFSKINENVSKRKFLEEVKKDTDLADLHETKKEKIKELDDKWNGKKSERFQCHFWPQFGKRLYKTKSSDGKERYVYKNRPKSKAKPQDVTDRNYTNGKTWMYQSFTQTVKDQPIKPLLDS